jgi:hypothetical protein
MQLLTVISSNVFQLVGELNSSRSTELTSSSIEQQWQEQQQGEEEKQQKHILQQQGLEEEQGRQKGLREQHQQEQHGEKQQLQKEQDQEKPESIPREAQLDGLFWVGWHCLNNVCEITDNLTLVLRCMWEQGKEHTSRERQGCGGDFAADCGGSATAAGKRRDKEACEETATPAPAEAATAVQDDGLEDGLMQGKGIRGSVAAVAVPSAIPSASPPPSLGSSAPSAATPSAAIKAVGEVMDDMEIKRGVAQGIAVAAPPAGIVVQPTGATVCICASLADKLGAPVPAKAGAEAGAGASGAVAELVSRPPATARPGGEGEPLGMGSSLGTESESSTIMIRSLSSLEYWLFYRGMAGMRLRESAAFLPASASTGRLHSAPSGCLYRLLEELSSSVSAGAAGAALKGNMAGAAARWKTGAAASAEVGEPAAGAAAVEAEGTIPLAVLCTAAPAVLGDILAAAVLGVDIELNLLKRERGDGTAAFPSWIASGIAAARHALLVRLQAWESMVQEVGLAAAAVEDIAQDVLGHMSSLWFIGLLRPAGFSCNNPRCGNLQGLSEVGVVVPGVEGAARAGEGAGVCRVCKAACYCCRSCQLCHMGEHLAFCVPALKKDQQGGGGGREAYQAAVP